MHADITQENNRIYSSVSQSHLLLCIAVHKKSLQDVFRAVVVSRIEYAAPAWSGMCSAADHTRMDQLEVADMFSAADDNFLQSHQVE